MGTRYIVARNSYISGSGQIPGLFAVRTCSLSFDGVSGGYGVPASRRASGPALKAAAQPFLSPRQSL
ncbi:hypothetical protein KCP78_20220 [Salmonella enterica subsp. enterica]|nr:hypothetical protein KCP78_20220 [Salmonella enterica subsp. enterica]